MNGYYEEMIEEIRTLFEKGEYAECMMMVKKELSMPYIPHDVEKTLIRLKRDITYAMTDQKEEREPSLNSLLNRLKGKPESQLSAAVMLSKRNLRECLEEIKDWLSKDPFEEAAAYMVEAIAEQSIGDEFTWRRNGIEYEFFGDSVTPVSQSKGFLEAYRYLHTWLENDHPDILEMTKRLLIHEVYMFLPLSYEEGEGLDLALEILKEVSDLTDDGEIYQNVIKDL